MLVENLPVVKERKEEGEKERKKGRKKRKEERKWKKGILREKNREEK